MISEIVIGPMGCDLLPVNALEFGWNSFTRETDMRKGRFAEEQIINVPKEHAAGLSAGDARRIIEDWRRLQQRPRTNPNGLTPAEFAASPDQGHNRNRLSL